MRLSSFSSWYFYHSAKRPSDQIFEDNISPHRIHEETIAVCTDFAFLKRISCEFQHDFKENERIVTIDIVIRET